MPLEDVRISRLTARLKKSQTAGPPIGVTQAVLLLGDTQQKNNLHTINEENPLWDFPLLCLLSFGVKI